MKILLIGGGSVGAYFGGRAVQGGAQLEVLAHREPEEIIRNGYVVESIAGNFSFHPDRVITSPDEVSPDIDFIVLATKFLPGIDRVKLLAPAAQLPQHPPVILIQNGVGIEDEIASAFPQNEIISVVAYIGSSRKSVNHICHTGAGKLIMGSFPGGVTPAAEQAAELFRAGGVECAVTENIALERWRKLLWNLPFNPVSVLGGGLDSSELCDGGDIEWLCSRLMDEVIAVANGCGVALTRAMADDQISYTRNFPPYRTSMLQDYSAGRPLEVDAILGNMVALAEKHRIPVPYARCCRILLESVNRKNPAAGK